MAQSTQTIPGILSELIGGMPGVVTAMAAMFGAIGLAMAAFAMMKVYQAVQEGDDPPFGWVVALIIGAALTITAVITGKSSLLFIS